ARTSGEDVEDDFGAVHHAHRERLLQVRPLRRRQRLVEQDERRCHAGEHALQLLDLALPEVEVGCGGLDPLEGAAHDGRAGSIGELAELLEMLLDLRGLGGSLAGGPDEKGALYRRLNFDESSDAAEPRSYKVLGPIITTPLAGGR